MDIIPNFFYGTAWKEEHTAELTELALEAGFRAIDTANQRKHYFEQAVGIGVQTYLRANEISREQIFLQTKFTYASGQDHRKPYDEKARLSVQVEQSFKSSLEHLGVDYIDSYILHGPYSGRGISAQDKEVWRAMEALLNSGHVKYLGVSNVSFEQLNELYAFAEVKPRFAQIRTYARNYWEKDLRLFCYEHGIMFQGFSLLTANQQELQSPLLADLAEKYERQIPQIIFRFAKELGIIPLTGTTNTAHMKADLDTDDFHLTAEDVEQLENVAFLAY